MSLLSNLLFFFTNFVVVVVVVVSERKCCCCFFFNFFIIIIKMMLKLEVRGFFIFLVVAKISHFFDSEFSRKKISALSINSGVS